MTRRHVDAERQRHSSVLVILLASFTIIRHFFCGALRKTHTLPDLTHRATHDMVIYNVRCSLLSVIKSHNLQNCSSYSQMFLQQVSEIKKTCSPIIITSNWICMKKKKNPALRVGLSVEVQKDYCPWKSLGAVLNEYRLITMSGPAEWKHTNVILQRNFSLIQDVPSG